MGILKIPRITTTNRTGLTLGLGELVYDTDLDEIYKGDGATSGGIAIASGTGDVVGPASAVNNHVVFFDNTTGKLIKDSGLTLSGTNTGDQTITLTGDVTGSGTGSFAATIANNSVTLGKMANVATGTVFYRTTAGTGSPEVQTLATLKTDLGLSGTNSGDQTITLTGDVTGSGTGSFATTIGANKVTLGMMATLSAYSIIGNNTGSSATPLALTGTQVTAILDTASATVNGVLSSSDWSTFNGKQAALSGTGIVKSTSGTISYLTDNSANWDTAYSDRLKWDGGATGLVASTGRTSLGLVIGTDVQAYDADLEAIATISGTSGLLKKTAINTWSLDTNTYLTTNTLLTGLAGGQTVIGGTAASNNLTLSSTSNATKGKILFGTSSYDEANNRLGIGTSSPTYPVHIVAGTLLDGQQSFYLSATSPTTRTSVYSFAQIDITSAGSSSFTQFGFNVNLLSGYTGAAATQCGRFVNTTSGTGTNIYVGICNVGAAANCSGTTTGANIGIGGSASGATTNIGNRSLADSNVANSTNLGMCGFANNTGTGTVYEIGGYFGLNTATPTFGASAALMCDNSTKAYDIFVARDNGTAVFKVTDNGNTIVGGLAAISTSATDGYLYLPTCAGIPTGTPTSYTGKAAMVIDTTNNKAYVYSGGAWRILN